MNNATKPDDEFTMADSETRRSLHNLLAVVAGGIVAGWAVGSAGLSVAWLLLLVIAVVLKWHSRLSTIINITRWQEMERVRRRRALAKSESAEWLNAVLHRWWINSEETLYRVLRVKVEPLLHELKPSFVEKIELKQFTFGDQTPNIQSVRSFDVVDGKRAGRNTQHNVELEVGVLLNSEQFRMLFAVRLFGKGIGMDVDVAMEKLYISGKLSVIFTLDVNSPFPHISNISISFLEKPDVWFTITVMKSLQMMEVPILKTWLHSIVVDALESALVNPGQISFHPSGIKLDAPTPNGEETNSFSMAQGVLIVTLTSLPDYVSDYDQKWMVLRVGDQTWRTRPIVPGWSESPQFLIQSLQRDRLDVKLKSKRLVTSITLAQYEMPLEEYNLDAIQSVETHLQKRNPRLSQMPSISLKLEYVPLPSIDFDASPQPRSYPSAVSGVMTVSVHGANGLSCNDSNLCNPYCIIFNNRKKVKSTPYFINTVNPNWQSKCQLLVSDYTQTSLSFVLCSWNLKKMTDDEMLGVGVLNITKEDNWVKNREILLSGNPGACLIVSVYFQPIAGMCEDSSNVAEDAARVKRNSSSSWVNQARNFLGRGDQDGPSGSDITNILASGMGLMEIALIAAKELLPMDLNGYSDPYCELKINSECKYKSSVKKKTLNPVWDENVIMPMPRPRETLDVMVWDHDTFGMKDFLGNVTFTLEEIRNMSTQDEPEWYVLKGVRSGQIQLKIKIISEELSYEKEKLRDRGSVESSPVVRRASMERSRVRLGVNVPPPTPPRTVSMPRPPALGRDARDSPELVVPTLTVTDSPTNTRASSQSSYHVAVESIPPSPASHINNKTDDSGGFRSIRLKVSRSLRLRRFRSEVNVRDSTEKRSAAGQSDEPLLNHAVSQPDIYKPQPNRPLDLNLVSVDRPDTYTGVQGRVIQAQGLHVAQVAQFYIRIKLLLLSDKHGVGKTLAKSHLLPSVPNPQFQLDFQIANPEVVPRQAALLFEIRSSTKEVLALRRVTLQDILPGDLKETHTWLALNNGATLEVSIGHGHIIKKKSKKLFRSWSVHRIGKI